jgi:hypothetical protein
MSVYKYMPIYIFNEQNEKINTLKYIFEDNTLRFSSPLSFNDPFELNPYIKNLINEEETIKYIQSLKQQVQWKRLKVFQMEIHTIRGCSDA